MLAVAGKVYGKDIRVDLVEVWSEFMRDITAAEGVEAMRAHVAESRFFPTVADIRQAVAERRVGAVDIGRAWEEVRRAISRYGRNKSPVFSHAAIENAVNTLGWIELCNSMEEDMPTIRAQFERYYKAGLETQSKQENVGRLEESRTGAMTAGDVIKLLNKGGK